MLKQNKNDELKSRLVKCSIPTGLEEILRDISSKVDVIFDKISEKDEVPETESDDYFEDQQAEADDVSDELKSDSDVKLLKKLLKRISLPCKQTAKSLDGIMIKVKEIENNTATIIKRNGRNCKVANTVDTEKLANNLTELGSNIQISLNSHFSEQRAHFATILKSNLIKNCLYPLEVPTTPKSNTTEYVSSTVSIPVSEEDLITTTEEITSSKLIVSEPYEIELAENVTSCEELPFDAKAGVYNFTDAEDFNLRFCREHWTIIQRRDNFVNLQNFSLPWVEYKFGFGGLNKDFWMGNEFLYDFSNKKSLKLRVELEDFDGNMVWAQYDYFKVASERENYKLFVGGYIGNASDSLSSHSNSSFSTYDQKNDAAPICCPCSLSYGGGWWFNSCFEANLNGVYHRNPNSSEYYRGIIWEHWLGNYSLKKTQMMVQPKLEAGSDENVTTAMFYPNIEDP
ncbi:fibrinogen/tenascin/angiopoeitin [Holotrichia oblita]|uniref:Fibrinogen/tenascin/angiopoeitin n=1 Tax=Holotrichia oblita TaxID=644536 RepID=A0ACB9SZY0_HOLOL|nr:fibrinogen/tenascin/angiopoeitin [Holotrichia oblita]